MTFGGAKGDRLFIACGNEVYFRRLNAIWWPLAPAPMKK
jgi:hypothetical protein